MYERFAPQTPTGVLDNARGIREFIVGTGGTTGSIDPPTAPNSEKIGNARGVMKFTLTSGNYSWEFIPRVGSVQTDSGSGTCH